MSTRPDLEIDAQGVPINGQLLSEAATLALLEQGRKSAGAKTEMEIRSRKEYQDAYLCVASVSAESGRARTGGTVWKTDETLPEGEIHFIFPKGKVVIRNFTCPPPT